MGFIRNLKKQIDEAFAESHRSEQKQSLLMDMLETYRETMKKREARRKKPEASQETVVAQAEAQEQQAKVTEELAKETFVLSTGATEPAKIDAALKATVPAGLMEHMDADFEMYPASACSWQGRIAIWPLANIVMGLPPNKKVVQIGADKRDFTRKNLHVVGDCEPETYSTPQEMRQLYIDRCRKSGKKFGY